LKGKIHGNGIYTWPDGKYYNGEYHQDQKQGYGIYRWPDGKQYEGGWLAGKQHGEGKVTNSKGIIKIGIWENGARTKWQEKVELKDG